MLRCTMLRVPVSLYLENVVQVGSHAAMENVASSCLTVP
jgi:hypothetical protein